jgi:hypothetical protein
MNTLYFNTQLSYLRLRYFVKDTIEAGAPSQAFNPSFLNKVQYFIKGLKKSFDELPSLVSLPYLLSWGLQNYTRNLVQRSIDEKNSIEQKPTPIRIDSYYLKKLSWPQFIQHLINGLGLNIKDYFNQNLNTRHLFSIANRNNHIDIVALLLDKKAEAITAEIIKRAFSNAVGYGRKEIVALILEKKEEVITPDVIQNALSSLNSHSDNGYDPIKALLEQRRQTVAPRDGQNSNGHQKKSSRKPIHS